MKLDVTLRRYRWPMILAAILVGLLGGCAASLDKNAKTLDLGRESVVVVSMKMENSYRPDHPLRYIGFHVEALDRPEPMTTSAARDHGAAGPAKPLVSVIGEVGPDGRETLLVQRLLPGRYRLTNFYGETRMQFPLSQATFSFDVDATFDVLPRAVTYLGHIDLVNREKKLPDDQASGLLLPLIPQAAAGFSGGTLDVKLKDRYAKDLAWLHSEYPATQTVDVLRAPLPALWLTRASGSKAEPVKVVLN